MTAGQVSFDGPVGLRKPQFHSGPCRNCDLSSDLYLPVGRLLA